MTSTNLDLAPPTILPGLTTPSQPISTSTDAPTPLPPATSSTSSTTSISTSTTLPATSASTSTSSTPSQPTTQKTILLINGPNLNLLGHREPHIYGYTTLPDIERHLHTTASTQNIRLLTFQSNHEGAIVDRIHAAFWANLAVKKKKGSSTSTSSTESRSGSGSGSASSDVVDAIIINPGAYTHTSVAIRDALSGVDIPFIECHISNVHAREEFRHKSFLSDKAEAVIAGLGVFGYVAALEYWSWKWSGGRLEDAAVGK